ncbi:MAG: HXXEE domain-containing protein [Gemmatimonadales bacterium]
MSAGRLRASFGALVLGQAAHSVEEYLGRLWESFPPARLLTGLVSANRELGFLVINLALVAFGLWCWLGPVRRRPDAAAGFVWFWVVVELINGVGHPLWSVERGGYTPGVATAPLLFALSLVVAYDQLRIRRARTLDA